MRSPRHTMAALVQSLDFVEYQRERARQFHGPALTTTPEQLIRRGIRDLDFDGHYFLATGETTPEGWAR